MPISKTLRGSAMVHQQGEFWLQVTQMHRRAGPILCLQVDLQHIWVVLRPTVPSVLQFLHALLQMVLLFGAPCQQFDHRHQKLLLSHIFRFLDKHLGQVSHSSPAKLCGLCHVPTPYAVQTTFPKHAATTFFTRFCYIKASPRTNGNRSTTASLASTTTANGWMTPSATNVNATSIFRLKTPHHIFSLPLGAYQTSTFCFLTRMIQIIQSCSLDITIKHLKILL